MRVAIRDNATAFLEAINDRLADARFSMISVIVGLSSFILLVVLGVALFAVTLALQSGRESGENRRAARQGTPPLAPRASGDQRNTNSR